MGAAGEGRCVVTRGVEDVPPIGRGEVVGGAQVSSRGIELGGEGLEGALVTMGVGEEDVEDGSVLTTGILQWSDDRGEDSTGAEEGRIGILGVGAISEEVMLWRDIGDG